MGSPAPPDRLAALEAQEPPQRALLLCALAGREVELDEAEANGAVRRGELLLATGGDPTRGLELDGRAVRAVADDLDTPDARRQLAAALDALAAEVTGLPAVEATLRELRCDPDHAWRCYAAALLASDR